MMNKTPGEVEIFGTYRLHLGPRYETAGLRVQFHYNQEPGIHFKAESSAEYRDSIITGLQDGMSSRFPDFPITGSLWITEVLENHTYSSQRAFYRAARMVIDQAFTLVGLRKEEEEKRKM